MNQRQTVAGVDEVGRGPLAGPVVVAAVVFETGQDIEDFHDSKTLSPAKREGLVDSILQLAKEWSLVALGPVTIDRLNILEATREAMAKSLQLVQADRALIDGNMKVETSTPYQSIIKGDFLHPEIGAASIIAKVWRDRLMKSYDEIYKGYDFGTHKGYPTKTHREALTALGPCPVHRFTFKTVAACLAPSHEQTLLSSQSDSWQISSTIGDYSVLPIPSHEINERSKATRRVG